ncbi:hypothetical protein [Mycolicibacterium brisbanense]|uniref:Uncharacterized protein n=1 Tax=Mycolicibacterium brisbanense TaxID=146020 RepID=A0A100VW21_9MYCO|nr:hypothetical protein [Mycolicibacterium brisbanense]MCV7159626.1 hypothetical protein [Mycolicibacterium brisbanense]GAS86946.1 uncharacterized protein RMCB_1042 [Mycolicibacterium brisbanense]
MPYDEDADFDDQFEDEDLNQRLAAAMAGGAQASGIPWQPFTDVQKREGAAYAAAMASVSAFELCGILDKEGNYDKLSAYDTCDQSNPATGELVPQGDVIVQMMAAQRLQQWHDACRQEDERLVNISLAPHYDQTDPLTATRLYVLTSRSRHAWALETPYDWKGHLLATLCSVFKCDAHLLHRCYDHQATPALNTLVYKRGEFVFGWKICNECIDALSWIGFGHPDYAGPLYMWRDKGERPALPEF